MSVKITPDGQMVITMKSLSGPEELIGLRTGIIDLLSQRDTNVADDFPGYCVFNLLKELELSEEQLQHALSNTHFPS